MAQGKERRSAISRSNKRNVIATKKKSAENGRQAELILSNPHLYKFAFSV